MKTVDITGVAMDVNTGAPFVLLQERDAPHRLLPILIGAADAAAIAYPATGDRPERPLTADLLAEVLGRLDARVETVEVTELREGTFFARVNLHTAAGHHSFDARPSDAIAVALRVDAPVLVSETLLDEVGALPPVDTDADTIDEMVEEFREFLDDLDPSQFGTDAVDAGPDSCSDGEDRPDEEGA